MGNRATVIFTSKNGQVSPTVYLHWEASQVPELLDKLGTIMHDRHGDPYYACARFTGLCHMLNPTSSTSLGVMPTDVEALKRKDWDALSPGDAGVVIVDTDDFTWRAYDGYLAAPKKKRTKLVSL